MNMMKMEGFGESKPKGKRNKKFRESYVEPTSVAETELEGFSDVQPEDVEAALEALRKDGNADGFVGAGDSLAALPEILAGKRSEPIQENIPEKEEISITENPEPDPSLTLEKLKNEKQKNVGNSVRSSRPDISNRNYDGPEVRGELAKWADSALEEDRNKNKSRPKKVPTYKEFLESKRQKQNEDKVQAQPKTIAHAEKLVSNQKIGDDAKKIEQNKKWGPIIRGFLGRFIKPKETEQKHPTFGKKRRKTGPDGREVEEEIN